MLTPAEEMGLSGLGLASRVRKAFYHIPEAELAGLVKNVHAQMQHLRVFYLRDGQTEVVPLLACPITALPQQRDYVHFVSVTIQNALKRLAEAYLEDARIREVLLLSPEEESWLRQCWGPSLRDRNPIFGRYDAVIDFISPMWKDSLRFIEPNMAGIGGLHMVPTAEHVLAEVVLPVLNQRDPTLHLEIGRDIRDLLIQELLEHLEALGRPGRNLCLVEPKYAGCGPEEQQELAHYFHEHYGLKLMHADPCELTLEKGEVYYQGDVVDLAYRDYSVCDLIQLEKTGVNVEPMRWLFQQNRMVSSIAGELDQKSCWEVLTDPLLLPRYFTADERQVFRRHILWTRLLGERRTTLPDSHEGDLLPFVRREREALVLKPNKGYGGQGVLLGPSVTQAEWEAAIEGALRDEERWVVQQVASLPVSEFPVLGPDDKVHVEPFYVVMGFAPSEYGVALVGRASQKQVVNVAQRGGICVVAFGQPPGRLLGPGPTRRAGGPSEEPAQSARPLE
jgi:hypothetical protein